MKLTKIGIQSFDNFQCAIHQTSSLSDIQKNDLFEKPS